jgi:glycosyltransferase involved in cell wall biosynthesis
MTHQASQVLSDFNGLPLAKTSQVKAYQGVFMKTFLQKSDLIVFSLNHWNSSFERTEQIMSRYACYRRVYFIEIPIIGISAEPKYLIRETRDDVRVVEPYLPENFSVFEQKAALVEIIRDLIRDEKIVEYSVWTDTPKAMPLIRNLEPKALMYDCLDDYSLTNPQLEKEIFKVADVVFASGSALYAAKRELHKNIYLQPDSIDYRHFYQARLNPEEPEDLVNIPHPRIGFVGTINHLVDLELVKNLATLRPDWHFVLAGALEVSESLLPQLENIHYLTPKSYVKLPQYLASFDCTFLPYKVNEETQFLNPSIVSQSLVSGCPVVATSLHDLVYSFDNQHLLGIADFPHDMIQEIQNALIRKSERSWLEAVDKNYKGMSWDTSCARLAELEHDIYEAKKENHVLQDLKFLHKIKGSILGRIYGDGSYGAREAYYRK